MSGFNDNTDDPDMPPLHPPHVFTNTFDRNDPGKGSPFESISNPQISRCSRIKSRMGICTSPFEDLENQLDDNVTNLKRINSAIINVNNSISRFEEIINKLNSTIDTALENEAVKPKLEDISEKIKKKIANQQSVAILKSNKEELENEKSLLESFDNINIVIKGLPKDDNYDKQYGLIKTNYTNIIDYYNQNYKNANYDTKINNEYDILFKNNVDALQKLINEYTENTLPKNKEDPRALSPRLEQLTLESSDLINKLSSSPIPTDNKMHCEIEDLYNVLDELYKQYDLLSSNDQTTLYWQQIVNKITEYEHMLDDIKCFDDGNFFGGKKKKGRKTKRRQKAVNRKTKKVKRVKRVKMVKKRKSKRRTRKSSRK